MGAAIDPARLVVLDEAGANLAMGRSHAWVLRGQEYVDELGGELDVDRRVRRTGWVTLNTKWRAVNTRFFVEWVRRRLAPRLRPHDIVLLDNLKAHKAPDVRRLVEARGATLRYLPPYSHDFSPIEPHGDSTSTTGGFARVAPYPNGGTPRPGK